MPTRRRGDAVASRAAVPLLISLSAAAPAALAQTDGRFLSVSPSLSIRQVFTDNADLSPTDRRSQTQTQVLPGVSVRTGQGGRVKLSLDYALTSPIEIGGSRSDTRIQQSLAAAMNAEVVERHAFIEARAAISQQSLSAFGVNAPDGFISANRNSTEVRSFAVSPVLRGNLAGEVDLEARANWTTSSSVSAQGADSTSHGWSVRASGGRGPLNWSVSHDVSGGDFGSGSRSTSTGRTLLSLGYRPDFDWRLTGRVGRESSDVQAADSRSSTTYGIGVEWVPTPRTTVNLQLDERYFGQSRSLSFQHRLRRTVFRISESRDVSNGNAFFSPLGTPEYERLMRELAPIIPDPVLRDQRVRELLGLGGGFITRAATLQERRDASMFWSGIRTSMSLSIYRSTSRRLDTTSTAPDDLFGGARVRQSGESVSGSYQLSPTTSLSLSLNQTASNEIGGSRSTDQRTVQIGMSSTVARNTGLSMSLRHVNFDSPTRPYTENGGSVSLNMTF